MRYIPLLIVLLAIYSIFYGAMCWIFFGFNGLLLGSIFMLIGGIFGVIISEIKMREQKYEVEK